MNSSPALKVTLLGILPFFLIALLAGWVAEMPVYFIALVTILLLSHYLLHTAVLRYTKKISYLSRGAVVFETSGLLFLAYYAILALAHTGLEIAARYTNNFHDTLSCRGPGCVALFFAIGAIPYLLVIIWHLVLFMREVDKSRGRVVKEGFYANRYHWARTLTYWSIPVLALGWLIYALSQANWS